MDDSSVVQGQIIYEVDCRGPEFPWAEVPWDAEFPKVIIECREQGTVSIEITCITSRDAAKTRVAANAIVERIIRELALQLSCSMGRPVEGFSDIPYVDAHGTLKRSVSKSATIRWGGSASNRWNPSVTSLQDVVVAARDTKSLQRDLDLELYRSATASIDLAARFIPLYTTLQKITGNGNQDDLDDWICTTGTMHVMPKPPERQNNHRTTETDFTRVRSLLGHVRTGHTSFSPVLDEARRLAIPLQQLIAKAIGQKYKAKSP